VRQEMKVSDRLIVTNRRFSYSVQKIWRMWSELSLIEQWWGPDGFTTTTLRFEFRVDGRWTFVMHGPDGKDYPNDVQFKVIDPCRYLRYLHLSNPRFDSYVEFKEIGENETELIFTQEFESTEQRNAVAVYAEPANAQIMKKLALAASMLD